MNLAILGPQGAGKGTQAKRLAAERGIAHLATGDIFREEIAARTELGCLLEPLLAEGRLVPDELTVELIAVRIAGARSGFVLDGFPRTLAQAEALDALLASIGRPLMAAIYLHLAYEVALSRIAGRSATEARADDTPEVGARRLAVFREQTLPVVEHYRSLGVLVEIHADRTISDVNEEIAAALAVIGVAPRSQRGRTCARS